MEAMRLRPWWWLVAGGATAMVTGLFVLADGAPWMVQLGLVTVCVSPGIPFLARWWQEREEEQRLAHRAAIQPPALLQNGGGLSRPHLPGTAATRLVAVTRPRVFIGSSSEGLDVAENLQVALESKVACEVTVWHQGVFDVSDYTMYSLVEAARQADFAILVASGDDMTESRGSTDASPRDNVIFELGLFMGVLGIDRVMILCPEAPPVRLPSDLKGFTRLQNYRTRDDGNLRAALQAAVLQAANVIEKRGPRATGEPTSRPTAGPGPHLNADADEELIREIDLICQSAKSQGWRVRTRSTTTLRLERPDRTRHTFSIPQDSYEARRDLRKFAGKLRANGLRVNKRARSSI